MADAFARIYPHDDVRGTSATSITSSWLGMPPRNVSSASYYIEVLDYLPFLELRFVDAPRTNQGVVFGSGDACDVRINHDRVAPCHFSILFDQHGRLLVRDWGSPSGTEVTYSGQGRGYRRNFQWILACSNMLLYGAEEIVVRVHATVSFRVVLLHRDFTVPEYANGVHHFRQGTDATVPLWDATKEDAIYLNARLGWGSYGVVTRYWNVSTGEDFARKVPSQRAIERKEINVNHWAREARIMSHISHPHIVRLIRYDLTPYPQLILDYVPGGSLENYRDISAAELVSILQQCLSALVYLHGNEPPIVHRDIKPENILVHHRVPGDIHVKLSDFGLSKESADLTTFCGSRAYIAPEIYSVHLRKGTRATYTPAVDVWSLGVTVFGFLCKLPRFREKYMHGGTDWAEAIVQTLREDKRNNAQELRMFLLENMVVVDPTSRASALDCYERAMLLPADGETHAVVNGQYVYDVQDWESQADGALADNAHGGEMGVYEIQVSQDPGFQGEASEEQALD